MIFLAPDVLTLLSSRLCRRSAERPAKKAWVEGLSPRAPGASEVLAPAPPKDAGSASPARDPSSSSTTSVLRGLQAPAGQGLLLVEADAPGRVDVDARDTLNAGIDQEAAPLAQAPDTPTGDGSPPFPPASGVPHYTIVATPDTPAAPEGLGDELASAQHGRDELEFEKRQIGRAHV